MAPTVCVSKRYLPFSHASWMEWYHGCVLRVVIRVQDVVCPRFWVFAWEIDIDLSSKFLFGTMVKGFTTHVDLGLYSCRFCRIVTLHEMIITWNNIENENEIVDLQSVCASGIIAKQTRRGWTWKLKQHENEFISRSLRKWRGMIARQMPRHSWHK